MDEKEFSQLQELIKEDKILIEVSRPYSGLVFGGIPGSCLWNLIILVSLASIVFFLIKGLFLYAILIPIALVVFSRLWAQVAFYYFYVRSLRNYKFFCSAYNSGIIRLSVGEAGPIISYPIPWYHIFGAIKNSQNSEG